MNTAAPAYITMLTSNLIMQLPILLACLGAGAVVLVRLKELGRSGIWALSGFGLGAVLCLLIPAVQTSVQIWVMDHGSAAQHAWLFSAMSIGWSILRAVSYVLLAVALLKGRGTVEPRLSN